MSMSKLPIQVPGEQKIDPKTGLPPVLNNADMDVNEVGRQREMQVRAIAMAATGGQGELAPSPAIDTGPALQERTMAGERVVVRVPAIRHNVQVSKYGPESSFPKGTLVRRDGTPCEGNETAYGVIGDIVTNEGILVHRVIPLEDEAA
jgi:hypothetical protein